MMNKMNRFGRRAMTIAAALMAFAPAPAAAQVLLYPPNFPTAPIEPSDPIVGIPLPGATPAESRASLVWNMRSGLNVAALQCQFSPYLRTVDNYNGILAHHSRELATAYAALEGYFRRVGARAGQQRFDNYSTQTYNNFSTFQGQLGFCQTAARIGRDALTRRKGEFFALAQSRMRELRASQNPAPDNYAFSRMMVPLAPLNLAPRDCSGLRGGERRECEGR